MSDVLATVVPLFGLIALGFVAARFRLFPPDGGAGLSGFVFNFAIPALLFRTLVHVEEPEASPLLLWGTYYGGLASVWVTASLLARVLAPFGSESSGIAAMAASFSNVVFLGLPLSVSAFGPEAALPVALIIAVNAPFLWFVGMVQTEWGQREEGASLLRSMRDLIYSFLRNPIIVALLLGAAWRVSGIGLTAAADRFVELLGACAVPMALFALGVSIGVHGLGGSWRAASVLAVLKLVMFPAAVWLIGSLVPGLPRLWLSVAIVTAACPTGVNAFLLAMRYQRAVAAVAGAIAIGTALAAFTLTLLLYWLRS